MSLQYINLIRQTAPRKVENFGMWLILVAELLTQ